MVYVTMMMAKVVTSVRMDGQGLKPSLLYFWNCSTNQRIYIICISLIIYMVCIELSHFGIYRPPFECLSLSLFISASWTIQNDLTFRERERVVAGATQIEANTTEVTEHPNQQQQQKLNKKKEIKKKS